MSLRLAILGSLSSAPASGYDLARQFGLGLGWFWSASHSQIYPELKRLEDAGLVEGSLTTVGEKLEKRVYSITDAGVDSLISLVTDSPLYPPNRDPERLQLIFSDLTSVDNVRRHLQAHLRHSINQRDALRPILDRIVEGKHERVQQRMSTMPPKQQALTLLLRELAYGGDIERAELELAWAQRALRALDEYERRYVEVDEVPPLKAQAALD